VTVLPDPPDFVTPGQPVEAIWGNEVVAWVREAVMIVNTLMPVGIVTMYGGGLEPPNWLFCRGQAVSTTTYSALYAVIGDRFNQGGPAVAAGQFRVPNMQARYPVGSNVGSSWGMGTFWSGGGVGEIAGSFDAAMPSHNHTVPDHLHRVDIWSGGRNAGHHHYGAGNAVFTYEGRGAYEIPLHYLPVGVGTDIGGPHYFHFNGGTGDEDTDHAHPVNGWSGAADRSLTSGLSGGGSSQIPPGVAFNFIIRAK
jgi:hypothetical protein